MRRRSENSVFFSSIWWIHKFRNLCMNHNLISDIIRPQRVFGKYTLLSTCSSVDEEQQRRTANDRVVLCKMRFNHCVYNKCVCVYVGVVCIIRAMTTTTSTTTYVTIFHLTDTSARHLRCAEKRRQTNKSTCGGHGYIQRTLYLISAVHNYSCSAAMRRLREHIPFGQCR